MTKSLEAPRKFQTYKQRHGHDINGVRPVMIPDDAGEWVNRFDAEHLAEQLKRAQLRIAELEALCVKSDAMREVVPLCVKLPDGILWCATDNHHGWIKRSDAIEAIRAAGGTVEGSE